MGEHGRKQDEQQETKGIVGNNRKGRKQEEQKETGGTMD